MGFKEGESGRSVVLHHKQKSLNLAEVEQFVQNEYNRHNDWQTDASYHIERCSAIVFCRYLKNSICNAHSIISALPFNKYTA